jgi:hypothetical protein
MKVLIINHMSSTSNFIARGGRSLEIPGFIFCDPPMLVWWLKEVDYGTPLKTHIMRYHLGISRIHFYAVSCLSSRRIWREIAFSWFWQGLLISCFCVLQYVCAKGKNKWVKEDSGIIDPNCSNLSCPRYLMRFTNGIGFEGKFYVLSS